MVYKAKGIEISRNYWAQGMLWLPKLVFQDKYVQKFPLHSVAAAAKSFSSYKSLLQTRKILQLPPLSSSCTSFMFSSSLINQSNLTIQKHALLYSY